MIFTRGKKHHLHYVDKLVVRVELLKYPSIHDLSCHYSGKVSCFIPFMPQNDILLLNDHIMLFIRLYT